VKGIPAVLFKVCAMSEKACVMLMILKMSSMFFSTAPIHMISLSAGNVHLCFPKQELTMCLLYKPGNQNNRKIRFFFHELTAFYKQASGRTEGLFCKIFVNLME